MSDLLAMLAEKVRYAREALDDAERRSASAGEAIRRTKADLERAEQELLQYARGLTR